MDNRKRVDEALPFLGALLRGIGSVGTRAASVGAKTGAGATRAATTTSKVGKFRQGLNLVRGMKQSFQDKRAAKKKARLAADQTMANTDMVQPDAIETERQRAEFNRSMGQTPRQDTSTHYITKAGVKFISEKVTPRTSLRLAHMIATGTNTRGTALNPKAVIRAMRASVKLGIAGDTARAVKAQTK